MQRVSTIRWMDNRISTCSLHICRRMNGWMQLKKRKRNQVKLADKNKIKVESITRVKIKLHDNGIKVFDEVCIFLTLKRI